MSESTNLYQLSRRLIRALPDLEFVERDDPTLPSSRVYDADWHGHHVVIRASSGIIRIDGLSLSVHSGAVLMAFEECRARRILDSLPGEAS